MLFENSEEQTNKTVINFILPHGNAKDYRYQYWPDGHTNQIKEGSTETMTITLESLKPGAKYDGTLWSVSNGLESDHVEFSFETCACSDRIFNRTGLLNYL